MSVENKRMQQRYGTYQQFEANKGNLLPNEFASVTSGDPNTFDGKSLYFAFGPGETKRLMTAEDAKGEMDAAVEEATRIATEAAESAQQSAEQAKEYFDQIPEKVEESKQAIADYTEAIKQTIPEDYTTLSELVDELDRTRAPGIVCTTTGEQISIDNASDQKFRGLKVYGKGEQVKTTGAQLLDLANGKSGSSEGVTYTKNEDGTYYANGTATGEAGNIWFLGNYGLDPSDPKNVLFILQPGTYTIKDCAIFSGTGAKFAILGESTTFSVESEFKVTAVRNPKQESGKTYNQTIYPMLNAGSSALPWEPYTGGQPAPSPEYPQEIHMPGENGSMNVNVTGNQLLDAALFSNYTVNGIIFTKQDDGGILVAGTSSQEVLNSADLSKYGYKAGTYYVKKVSNKVFSRISYKKSGELYKYIYQESSGQLDDFSTYESIVFQIYVLQGNTVNETVYPMLNAGSSALPWEPFKQPQTLQITTPNGLPGIPVTSGGNYTDQKGQQWISDVKDYETGKYTQMVHEVVLDGSVDEQWNSGEVKNGYFRSIIDIQNGKVFTKPDMIMCTSFLISGSGYWTNPTGNVCTVGISTVAGRFGFVFNGVGTLEEWKSWLQSNPVTVVYPLATPIVTDIPAEEMAAYNAMHSNYPNTNVFSDQDVEPGMEVKHTADTKMYVDGKFQALAEQIINSIGGSENV